MGGQEAVRGQSPDGCVLTPPLAAAATRETWQPLRTPAAACRRRGRGRCQEPLTRPAPARHSRLLQHRGGSDLTPSRSRPSASTECAGRARRCEPSATEAVPPPLPSLVGGLCVWELAQWRTRFAANFGGRLRVGVGGTWKAAAAASRHRDRFQLWTSVTPRCPQVGSLPLQGLGSADAVRQTSCTSSEVGAQDRMECGERAACDPCTLRDHQGGARRGEAKERF